MNFIAKTLMTTAFISATFMGISTIDKSRNNMTINPTTKTLYCQTQTADIQTIQSLREIYDLLSPEIISFYENEIAHEKVVSNMREQKLEYLSKQLGISMQKTKAILLLQNIAERTGDSVELKVLANKTEGEILQMSKGYIERITKQMSDEEKLQLKEKFKQQCGGGYGFIK